MGAMTWLLVAGGTVLTTAAVVLFLYSLWLGLHRHKWLPLVIVSGVWLVAMTAYALLDSESASSGRQRIGGP